MSVVLRGLADRDCKRDTDQEPHKKNAQQFHRMPPMPWMIVSIVIAAGLALLIGVIWAVHRAQARFERKQ